MRLGNLDDMRGLGNREVPSLSALSVAEGSLRLHDAAPTPHTHTLTHIDSSLLSGLNGALGPRESHPQAKGRLSSASAMGGVGGALPPSGLALSMVQERSFGGSTRGMSHTHMHMGSETGTRDSLGNPGLSVVSSVEEGDVLTGLPHCIPGQLNIPGQPNCNPDTAPHPSLERPPLPSTGPRTQASPERPPSLSLQAPTSSPEQPPLPNSGPSPTYPGLPSCFDGLEDYLINPMNQEGKGGGGPSPPGNHRMGGMGEQLGGSLHGSMGDSMRGMASDRTGADITRSCIGDSMRDAISMASDWSLLNSGGGAEDVRPDLSPGSRSRADHSRDNADQSLERVLHVSVF